MTANRWPTVAIFLVFLSVAVGQRITSPANQTINSEVNAVATSFTCTTADLGTAKVNWVFVNHNTQLFNGDTKLTSDQRVTLSHPADNANVHSLQILRPQGADQGTYKCEIAGTTQSALFNLVLSGSPVLPGVDSGPPLNRTECCKQRNVSAACLQICQPSTMSNNFDITMCAKEMGKLLFCAADGRNHQYCCAQSGVPGLCLPFCSVDPLDPFRLDMEHLACLSNFADIVSCYQFGAVVLPTPPQRVSALSVVNGSNYSLLLTWQAPQFNPSTVTGYIVKYKRQSDAQYTSTTALSPSTYRFSIKAELNTRYSIFVVAVGYHGSSLPSNNVIIVMTDPSANGNALDVAKCCAQQGVSSACQSSLCHSAVWKTFNTSAMLSCYTELGTVFSCLAGSRNNTECCIANNVPEDCLGMCSGHPPTFTKSLAACVPRLAIIEACVQNGLATIPPAPVNVRLESVGAFSAVLLWDAPNVTGLALPQEYYVQLRRGFANTSWATVEKVVGTNVMLMNLTDREQYSVRVVSNAGSFSSLPSPEINFQTYPVMKLEISDTVVHNLTECCKKSGMPELCYNGCHYSPYMTAYYANKLETCGSHIGTVLTCAADGRDHTKCCVERKVLDVCLPMCQFYAPGPLDPKYFACIEATAIIVQCFSEGLEDQVRKPESAFVYNVTQHTISVNWTSPSTGPKPSSFIVSYQPSGSSTNTTMAETNYRTHVLQNLKAGTVYTIYIQSYVNTTGLTSPPIILTAQTLPLTVDIPYVNVTEETGRVLWTNRTHCCQSGSISQACQPLCMNQPYPNATDCSLEELNILTCAADGRDHTLCCRENGLPETCLPICGSHAASNYSVLKAMCHADAALQIITSCFFSYTGLLPDVPREFRVAYNGYEVQLSWGGADKCGTSADSKCTYDVHYWLTNSTDLTSYTTVTNQASPALIRDLAVNAMYTFTVTAHNSKGSGPAAPWQSIFITAIRPDISIAQDPKNDIHEQGSRVALVCNVFNYGQLDAPQKYVWQLRDQVLGTMSRILVRTGVSELNEGNYTCSVTWSPSGMASVTVTATSYLNVRYKPQFSYFRTDSVSPNIDGEALMACWFRGHPNISYPISVWTQDGKAIPNDSRHSFTVDSRLHTGITAFQLKISQVVASDYGIYQCNVSNQYGSYTVHTKLSDPNNGPPPVTGVPLQAKNMTACCQRNGVHPVCMPICTLEVSLEVALADPNRYGVCLVFLDEMVTCAADGADHSLCCVDKVVKEICLPFCAGNVPIINNNFEAQQLAVQCIGEAPDILDCMERGYEKIPTAPQHVVASLISNQIKVSWDPPARHADKVTSYHINYNFTGRDAYETETVTDLVGFQHVLTNVNPGHIYHIWMTAENYQFGVSQPSNMVDVATLGTPPSPPTDVKVKSLSGTTVVIEWSPLPQQSEHANSFAVYYKPFGAQDYQFVLVRGDQLTATLTGLKGETTYMAYVRARNFAGEGQPSASITFITGPEAGTSAQSAGLTGGETAGIIIGVLIIAAVVVVITFLIYRFRRTTGRSKMPESVAFENPAFPGHQQVHIGGNGQRAAETEGSFSYARLDEEQTVAAASAVSSGKSAAPVNMTRTQPADPASVTVAASGGDAATLEVSSPEPTGAFMNSAYTNDSQI